MIKINKINLANNLISLSYRVKKNQYLMAIKDFYMKLMGVSLGEYLHSATVILT